MRRIDGALASLRRHFQPLALYWATTTTSSPGLTVPMGGPCRFGPSGALVLPRDAASSLSARAKSPPPGALVAAALRRGSAGGHALILAYDQHTTALCDADPVTLLSGGPDTDEVCPRGGIAVGPTADQACDLFVVISSTEPSLFRGSWETAQRLTALVPRAGSGEPPGADRRRCRWEPQSREDPDVPTGTGPWMRKVERGRAIQGGWRFYPTRDYRAASTSCVLARLKLPSPLPISRASGWHST